MAEQGRGIREYTLPFAAWELRLYLNSHPHDRCALRQYQQMTESMGCFTYAHTGLDYPACPGGGGESALAHMDGAASQGWDQAQGSGTAECCCVPGAQCPVRWAWAEDPWPWEGSCPGCTQ